MFCKNCGSEIADDAVFCNNCGTPVNSSNQSAKIVEDGEVIFEIKPTFKWGYEIVCAILKSIVMTLVIIYLFINPYYYMNVFIAVIIFYFIKLFFDKVQYRNTSYKFYKTKVEYVDGFLNKEMKEVKYKHIKEVTKTENIIERMFKFGKIKMTTNVAMAKNNNKKANNGIIIHCIENVSEISKKINQLVEAMDDDEE